jgi:hypothetical protein
MLAALTAYATYVEPALDYYFIPVYALVCACATDRKGLAVLAIVGALSAVVLEGPFELFLPIAAVFVLGILQGSRPAGASPH